MRRWMRGCWTSRGRGVLRMDHRAVFGAGPGGVRRVAASGAGVEKLALSVVVVSASSMMYWAIVALLNKKLDWIFAVLVLATLGVGSWYVVLLVEDRDSTITALKEQIGTAVDVPPTVTTERPQPSPPRISPAPQSTTPAESALPDFDQSDAGAYSTGTVTLTVGSEGLDIHPSSWMEYEDSENRASRSEVQEYSDRTVPSSPCSVLGLIAHMRRVEARLRGSRS